MYACKPNAYPSPPCPPQRVPLPPPPASRSYLTSDTQPLNPPSSGPNMPPAPPPPPPYRSYLTSDAQPNGIQWASILLNASSNVPAGGYNQVS